MYCRCCGNKISDDAVFCDKCGAKIDRDQKEGCFSSISSNSRQSVYDGVIHKCPNCGHLLDAYMAKCPECGYELRGEKSGHPVEKLSEMLQNSTDSERKKDLISTFYIPNTKEDIYDFFILSVSMADDQYCNEAWIAKLDQAYLKAKMMFNDSKNFSELHKLYKKAKKAHGVYKTKQIFKRNLIIIISAILLVAGILLLVFGFGFGDGDEDFDGTGFEIGGFASLEVIMFIWIFYCGRKDEEKERINKENKKREKQRRKE